MATDFVAAVLCPPPDIIRFIRFTIRPQIITDIYIILDDELPISLEARIDYVIICPPCFGLAKYYINTIPHISQY
jgi:hypothetical protein